MDDVGQFSYFLADFLSTGSITENVKVCNYNHVFVYLFFHFCQFLRHIF